MPKTKKILELKTQRTLEVENLDDAINELKGEHSNHDMTRHLDQLKKLRENKDEIPELGRVVFSPCDSISRVGRSILLEQLKVAAVKITDTIEYIEEHNDVGDPSDHHNLSNLMIAHIMSCPVLGLSDTDDQPLTVTEIGRLEAEDRGLKGSSSVVSKDIIKEMSEAIEEIKKSTIH